MFGHRKPAFGLLFIGNSNSPHIHFGRKIAYFLIFYIYLLIKFSTFLCDHIHFMLNSGMRVILLKFDLAKAFLEL